MSTSLKLDEVLHIVKNRKAKINKDVVGYEMILQGQIRQILQDMNGTVVYDIATEALSRLCKDTTSTTEADHES